MSTTQQAAHPAVVGKLSTLDRFLPVWIGVAMAAGLLLGRLIPGLGDGLSAVEVDGISLPIAIGLLVMMYPVLAKDRYDRLDSVTGDRRGTWVYYRVRPEALGSLSAVLHPGERQAVGG